MSREKVKEIVDYMVSEGTQNTNYGCWAFDIPELCDKFDLPPRFWPMRITARKVTFM